jgi:hypothetical protein
MKITKEQFEIYVQEIPPVIWAWIYTELKQGEAKQSLRTALFNESDQCRDLTQPWIRKEVNYLISRFPEIRTAAETCAVNYYIRHSWRKWLPWNWGR